MGMPFGFVLEHDLSSLFDGVVEMHGEGRRCNDVLHLCLREQVCQHVDFQGSGVAVHSSRQVLIADDAHQHTVLADYPDMRPIRFSLREGEWPEIWTRWDRC